MAKLIALAGKGGTGKTTVAALLIRSLLRRGLGPVLAVDADPNATLPEALGLPPPRTIGMIREEFGELSMNLPAGMTKDSFFELKLNEIIAEQEGFDLLVMGRPEGAGCYCYVNNLLRAAVERIATSYAHIVVDNEAGLEHLSRRTTAHVDLLVVVSDHSVRGIRSAHRVVELASELGLEVRDRVVLVNRTAAPAGTPLETALEAAVRGEAETLGLRLFGAVPEDEAVSAADLGRRSLLELPATAGVVRATESVIDYLVASEGESRTRHAS